MKPNNVLPTLWAKWYFDNFSGKSVGKGSGDSAYAEAILILSKACLATARNYRIGTSILLIPDFDIAVTDSTIVYTFRLSLMKNGRRFVSVMDIKGNTLTLRAGGFGETLDFSDAMLNGITLEEEYEDFIRMYGTKPVLRSKMRFKPEYNFGWAA